MRLVWLGMYLAMMIGGILTFILQLLYSPAIQLRFAAGSAVIAVFRAYLPWEDFLS